MKKQKQNGSASVVIVILAVIAILGVLGFILWQNFLKPKPVTTQTITSQTTQVKAVAMKKGQIDSSFPVTVSWNYPETWSLTKKGNGPASVSDSADETFTLTSPSKNYSVIYEVAQNEGFGGTCDSTSNPSTIQYISKQAVSNFSKAIFVESIVDSYSTLNGQSNLQGYTYNSALLNSSSAVENARVGGSQCDVHGLLGAIRLNDNPTEYLMRAQISLNAINQYDQYNELLPIKDLRTIESRYNSSEYKDAVSILLSTK